MSWKKDRDALIAQTMAFVQSVTGRREDAGLASTPSVAPSAKSAVLDRVEQEPPPKPVLEPVRVAPPAPLPADTIGRYRIQGEMANEIRARIASFRAHQERFNREREEYFSETLARLKAMLKEIPPAQRHGK